MGFIVFTIFIILFDQASKLYIQHNMHIGESIPLSLVLGGAVGNLFLIG